jgi:hypothetical protein
VLAELLDVERVPMRPNERGFDRVLGVRNLVLPSRFDQRGPRIRLA